MSKQVNRLKTMQKCRQYINELAPQWVPLFTALTEAIECLQKTPTKYARQTERFIDYIVEDIMSSTFPDVKADEQDNKTVAELQRIFCNGLDDDGNMVNHTKDEVNMNTVINQWKESVNN